jgi:hypothetical protein
LEDDEPIQSKDCLSHWVKWAMLGSELTLGGKSQSQMNSEGVVKFSLGQTGACWVEFLSL